MRRFSGLRSGAAISKGLTVSARGDPVGVCDLGEGVSGSGHLSKLDELIGGVPGSSIRSPRLRRRLTKLSLPYGALC